MCGETPSTRSATISMAFAPCCTDKRGRQSQMPSDAYAITDFRIDTPLPIWHSFASERRPSYARKFLAVCRCGRGPFDKGMKARGATPTDSLRRRTSAMADATNTVRLHRVLAPRRARLSRLPRPRRAGQMAPAARLYRQGPPERRAGGRQLPHVVHQLPLRHDPCLWRHVRRTDAARADQVYGHVRRSAPARGDARRDHAAPGRRWHRPGHRAGRSPAAMPVEMCYLGWQESLRQLADLVEAEMPDGA